MRRLGILISSDAVRALLVRRGRVTWHAHVAIEQAGQAGRALDRVLSTLPPARIGGTTVRVALGLAHSDTKRVDGLPPARDPRILNSLVKENADAFFLRLGARTLVANVDHRADGSKWASAFDAALLDEVFGILRRRRLFPAGVMSFAVAVSRTAPAGTWCARDADLEVELTTIEGAIIQSCRRRVVRGEATDSRARTVATPGNLGAAGPEFLAAYGAAIAPAHALVAWRPAPDPARVRAREARRIAAASLLLVASAGAAVAARGVHADRVAGAATRELAMFRKSEATAARVDAELRRTTVELDRIHRFEANRGRVTALLGAISEALPDSTALVSLRVDSVEGNLVTLTPHAANVLPPLFDVPGVVAPRIVGSVTREVQGTARVERASIRFRRNASAPSRTGRR